jgi:adenosylcobinamide kinase / adenosylcobinamide-phosphate guanylyltransferase
MSPGTVLVLGGVRAGKSAFAVARARELGGRVVFVATAEAGDDEMAARIARHRAERPSTWRTIEAPLALVSVLTTLDGEADVVIVDCLNLWIANILDKRPALPDSDLLREADGLAAVAARPDYTLLLVSNEVGWGIHPQTELGRRFRDALGLVNQAAARAAGEVVLMVAGCPLTVKAPDTRGLADGGWRE